MGTAKDPTFQKMGVLRKNRAAPYNFSIGNLLSEAWRRVSGLKASAWGAIGFIYLVIIGFSLLTFISSFVSGLLGLPPVVPNTIILIISFITAIIALTLRVGLYFLGVKRAVDLPIKAKSIFSYFRFTGRFVGALIIQTFFMILIGILGSLSFIFFPPVVYPTLSTPVLAALYTGHFIFGFALLYVSFSGMFMFFLIAEKKLGMWPAFKASFLAFSQHWFKIMIAIVCMIIIIAVSAIPLGIGIIWTFPMLLNFIGILYRTAFGVEAAR